jgi:long-chain acyl-CoA synthetase
MGRDVVTCETITQLFNGAIRRGGQNRFQWWRTGPDTTESLTYTQVGYKVKDLCGALLEMGIEKSDRIAIMAPNCPQWMWADMAILNAGGVTVTIYPTSSEHELTYIINDSGCRAIFVKDADILQRVLNSVNNLPTLEKIIVMDSDYEGDHPLLISIDDMFKKGAVYLAQNPTAYEERWHSVQPWDWATIVYTSGTTGQSKGALHTHRSIMAANYRDDYNIAISGYSFDENDVNLCFLPLSHTYERQMGEMMIMMYGGTIAYAQKASTVIQDIQVFQPTYFMSVPRIYERIYMTLRDMACKTEQGRQMFEKAMEIGMQVIDARTQENGSVNMGFDVDMTAGLPEDLKTKYLEVDKNLFNMIRGMLGSRFRVAYSASAALSSDLCKAFLAMGIRINEGYGLTETCNSIIYNDLRSIKPGSVGKVAAGVDTRIAEDGELQVRAENLFLKYFNKPEETREAFTEDGYFKTGDIVEVDEYGYYKIVDRKKAIMVLDTGKKVPRAKVESPYSTSRYIEQIFVNGDDRKYVTALVVPKFAWFVQYFKENDISFDESKVVFQGEGADLTCIEVGEDFISNPVLQEMIAAEIEEYNQFLESHEAIKKWAILPRQFLLERDEITPTLKTKAKVIKANWAETIEKLYAE